ncbi:MAG: hypothetical protein JWO56_3225 [Acidobacteria bacterium]|nr:hypothetical protein [Acidobacteriota bacterium]
MLRRLLIFTFLLALPLVARANCSLQMTMTCTTGSCSATTINNGTSSCTGEFFIGFLVNQPATTVSVTNLTNNLGLGVCFDSSILGQQATIPFAFCSGDASLPPGASFTGTVGIHAQGSAASLPVTAVTEVIDSTTGNETGFAYAFNQLSVPTCTPAAVVASQAQSGLDYNVSWSATVDPQTQYQIDESTTQDFSANVTSRTVAGTSATFRHSVQNTTTFYYRVRATSCGGAAGPYSSTVSTIVLAPLTISSGSAEAANVVLPFGSTTPFSFSLQIPPLSGKTALATSYSAISDKPYLLVTPPSGTIPPQGLTLTVTAAPTGLPPGASTGTITVTTDAGAKVAVVPVSVTLATPVGPGAKTLPTANTLIIPVVTHVNGATAPFESDVRLTNAGEAATTYQITLTPTRTDGTQGGKATQVTVGAGQTLALNDIARTLFGFGATGQPTDVGFGALEIRPLNDSAPKTYAASRTYATTPRGTYGQFIPAIPFSAFASIASALPFPIGGGTPSGAPPVLSIQQIAESAKFRTNLGIVEGSGAAASGTISIFNDAGTKLKAVPFSLKPGEHQQLNGFLANNGVTLDDGRIEISLESLTGAVTAYASVVDNTTSDPLAVTPVQPALISANRYVVPGIADLIGGNNFHSDLRIYNGGSVAARVSATFYPQNNGTVTAAPSAITIAPGETKAFDNVLPSLFNVTRTGGSVVLTTDAPSSLVATARTYTNAPDGGTFGQFIPGVTSKDGVGLGERPMQILQLEESAQFRSNVGLAELTGNPVHVRLSLYVPDSKVAGIVETDLGPNQFLQIGRLFAGVYGSESIYNGRVAVEVTSGIGRVTAFGSVIDNSSSDPTYVPSQQ